MALQGYGLAVSLPSGWNGRIFTHGDDPDSDNRPSMHLTSFALPVDEGDFGTEVVSAMSAADTFMSLVEYTPDSYLPAVEIPDDPASVTLDTSSGPFSNVGIPVVKAADFSPAVVLAETSLPAVTAVQYPFTAGGRPFVLYVVVGDQAQLNAKVSLANSILDTLVISPAFICRFDALRVSFSPAARFIALVDIGSSAPPAGSCSGTGPATAVLARSDGGSTQSLTANLSFTGTYKGKRCIDNFNVDGTLTIALSDGRTLNVPVAFDIPVMERTQVVGTVGLVDDPIALPAIFNLIGGPCDGTSGVSIGTSFVSPLGLAGAALRVVTGTPRVTSGVAAVPLQWGGVGIGQGTIDIYEVGQPRAASNSHRPRRRRIGGRNFTMRGGRRRTVRVRLTAAARRELAARGRLGAVIEVEVRDARGNSTTVTRSVTLRKKHVHRQAEGLRPESRRRPPGYGPAT